MESTNQILERIALALENIEYQLSEIAESNFAHKMQTITENAEKMAEERSREIIESDMDGIVLKDEFMGFIKDVLSF